MVYRLGNWEYSYKYRDAPNSAQFSTLRYGTWVLELKAHLQAQVDGTSKIKYFHNVRMVIVRNSLLLMLKLAFFLDRSRWIHFSSPWVLADCRDGMAWNVSSSFETCCVHFVEIFFSAGVPK